MSFVASDPVETPARRTAVCSDGPAASVVEVRDLAKAFGRAAPILHNVSFEVRHGERVALIGANGTGKSTLLRSLVRLVEPDSGDVGVFGTDVRALSRRRLARLRARVGFVFQRHNLVTRLSALSNVVHGGLARRRSMRLWHQALAPHALRDEALACLARVHLSDRALQRADSLSGGQSQRVAIARMLMQAPDLVLADEPVASLDPKSGEEVMELFVSLVKSDGRTLLFTTHHMEHALAYADRVLGLGEGRVVLDAPVDALNPAELRAFFG